MRWWMLALMGCGPNPKGGGLDTSTPTDSNEAADTEDTQVPEDTVPAEPDPPVEPTGDDLLLLVDITHEGIASPETVPQLKSALEGFVDAVAVDADRRMGIVHYAGASEVVSEIRPLASHLDEVRSAATSVEPCSVDQDAWYYFWRYYNLSIIMDPELGDAGFDYAYVGSDGTPNVPLWSPEGQLIQFLLTGGGSMGPTAGMTEGEFDAYELTLAEQCGLWQVSQFQFEMGDPRRRRQRALGLGPATLGTLACHEGHYLDSDPDRFDRVPAHALIGLDCVDGLGSSNVVPNTYTPTGQPVPQYGGLLQAGVPQMADFSYTQAGSRPGVALERAVAMLEVSEGDEQVVVLVAGNGYRCPPTLDGGRVAACAADLRAEMVDRVAVLEAGGVHTHVVGVVEAGSQDETRLTAMVTGQGGFHRVDTVDQVGAALTAIAAGLP